MRIGIATKMLAKMAAPVLQNKNHLCRLELTEATRFGSTNGLKSGMLLVAHQEVFKATR